MRYSDLAVVQSGWWPFHLTWTGVTGVDVFVITGTLSRRHQQVVCRLWREEKPEKTHIYIDTNSLSTTTSPRKKQPVLHPFCLFSTAQNPSPTRSPVCHKHFCLLRPPAMAGGQIERRRKEEGGEEHWILFKTTRGKPVIISYSLDPPPLFLSSSTPPPVLLSIWYWLVLICVVENAQWGGIKNTFSPPHPSDFIKYSN